MTIRDFLKGDPMSDEYVLPAGKTPKDLVRLLLVRQKIAFGSTVLENSTELTYRILQRNFKLLLKKYPADILKRGIEISVRVGEHPGSTKTVENCIEWYLFMKGQSKHGET